jgi:cytochrome c peroxidase
VKHFQLSFLCGALGIGAVAACSNAPPSPSAAERLGQAGSALGGGTFGNFISGSYNLQLRDIARFEPLQPGSDPVHGRQLFGASADLQTQDNTFALFQGPSQAFQGVVVSNGRACFTCHRGPSTGFGFPKPPLSASIPLTDPLFTGIDGDAQGDPDAMNNLDNHALIKHRIGRFNEARSESDPYRQVFGWRKSLRLLNVAFGHGFLTDGRARDLFEADRGAVFAHTQSSDSRFDDLFPPPDANDMEAFQFSAPFLTDPQLAALRDPTNPLYARLVSDPFYTVHTTSKAQDRGKWVFVQQCMVCHNTPNVFNNISNVQALGGGIRPITDPAFGPPIGRDFNVGISERNGNNLRFTQNLGGGQFAPIVLPLANEDGTTNNLTITFDIGLAAVTARSEDIGRFKVPQLRGVVNAGPYFHDNSADTLEQVVDYFNSAAYAASKDGRKFPVHLNAHERADLLEFLKVL